MRKFPRLGGRGSSFFLVPGRGAIGGGTVEVAVLVVVVVVVVAQTAEKGRKEEGKTETRFVLMAENLNC